MYIISLFLSEKVRLQEDIRVKQEMIQTRKGEIESLQEESGTYMKQREELEREKGQYAAKLEQLDTKVRERGGEGRVGEGGEGGRRGGEGVVFILHLYSIRTESADREPDSRDKAEMPR